MKVEVKEKNDQLFALMRDRVDHTDREINRQSDRLSALIRETELHIYAEKNDRGKSLLLVYESAAKQESALRKEILRAKQVMVEAKAGKIKVIEEFASELKLKQQV